MAILPVQHGKVLALLLTLTDRRFTPLDVG
jgi:hypothetical protein